MNKNLAHTLETSCSIGIKAIRKLCKNDFNEAPKATQYLLWQAKQLVDAAHEINKRAYRDKWNNK